MSRENFDVNACVCTRDLVDADAMARGRRLIQLSGPSQATTLLAEAFLFRGKLGYTYFDWRALNFSSRCARVQEFFNPECHHAGQLQSVLLHCFGTSFRVCKRSEYEEALAAFEATAASYVKENFALLTIDLFAAMPDRWDVIVSFRPPWLTFPLDRPWYPKMYRAFLSSSIANEQRWPADSGHGLRALKDHLARTHPPDERTSQSLQGCIAHYVHFFFLVTRARALGKPVIRIDRLLTLPTVTELEMYLHSQIPSLMDRGSAVAMMPSPGHSAHALASAIEQLRKVPTHMHSPLAGFRATEFVQGRRRGMANVSDLIHRSHKSRWHQTGCAVPLRALARWCEEQLGSLCAKFNREYGLDEVADADLARNQSQLSVISNIESSISGLPFQAGAAQSTSKSSSTFDTSLNDFHSCASLNTVVGVVASARYGRALVGLSHSAVAAGFGCVAVQAVGPQWFPELGHPRVRALPRPGSASGPPLLPHAPWCNRSQMAFAYTKRLTQLYKAFMLRAVLRMGFHLLAVDCDWRFLAVSALPFANRVSPMMLNPAAHALTLKPEMDVVALHDGYGFKQLNIGLMWMRHTPLTLVLAERVLNRTRGAWDQLVLNEELNFRTEFRNISCCHTEQLLCLLNHSAAESPAQQVRELPARRCWGAHDRAVPTAADPPVGTRNRWTSPWQAQGFNTLHISMRRTGRCTLPTAKCTGWSGPRGILQVVRPNVPAAIGLQCKLSHASS